MANFNSKISILTIHDAYYLYNNHDDTSEFIRMGIYRYFAYKGPPGQLGYYELRVYASNEFEAYICLLDLGYEHIEIL